MTSHRTHGKSAGVDETDLQSLCSSDVRASYLSSAHCDIQARDESFMLADSPTGGTTVRWSLGHRETVSASTEDIFTADDDDSATVRSLIQHNLKSISLTSKSMSQSAAKSHEKKMCLNVSDLTAAGTIDASQSQRESHLVAVAKQQRMSVPLTKSPSTSPNLKPRARSVISSTLGRLRHLALPSFSRFSLPLSTPSSPKSCDGSSDVSHDDSVFTYDADITPQPQRVEPELSSMASATYSSYDVTQTSRVFETAKYKHVTTHRAMDGRCREWRRSKLTSSISRSKSAGSMKDVPAYALFLQHPVLMPAPQVSCSCGANTAEHLAHRYVLVMLIGLLFIIDYRLIMMDYM